MNVVSPMRVDADISVTMVICILMTLNPRLSVDAIQKKLMSVGLSPTRILIASVRNSFKRNFDFLDDAGLID